MDVDPDLDIDLDMDVDPDLNVDLDTDKFLTGLRNHQTLQNHYKMYSFVVFNAKTNIL